MTHYIATALLAVAAALLTTAAITTEPELQGSASTLLVVRP